MSGSLTRIIELVQMFPAIGVKEKHHPVQHWNGEQDN